MEAGNQLSREELERRYERMPHVKKRRMSLPLTRFRANNIRDGT